MTPEKRILILMDWYKPGYKAGGPIQSCANLVAHLKDEFQFFIVTRNSDFGETLPYPGITPDTWTPQPDGSRVYYVSPGKLNHKTICSFITVEYSVVYLNSLFSAYFTIIPLLFRRNKQNAPVFVMAPRGMLGKGALLQKPLRKKIFLALAKLTGVYSQVRWHASTPAEADEIRAVFPAAVINVALNLPPLRTLAFTPRIKTKNNLKLFFLSRISPKKNLLGIFEYLEQVDERFKIEFDIIGPAEDAGYWKQCQEKMQTLASRPNLKINYRGSISNSALPETLKGYHFMILPTLNENFGHVILDALASGCPLIISNQTPWKDLPSKGIGWDLSLSDKSGFTAAIEKAAGMQQEEFMAMSQKAFAMAQAYYQDKEIVEQNKMLF
jgi:glycosyltransferase involved in cell wall biosynthesis